MATFVIENKNNVVDLKKHVKLCMKNLQSWLQKNETFQNKMSDLRRRGKVDKKQQNTDHSVHHDAKELTLGIGQQRAIQSPSLQSRFIKTIVLINSSLHYFIRCFD